MKGVLLFEVSKLLRHASIQMTERYAHLVNTPIFLQRINRKLAEPSLL